MKEFTSGDELREYFKYTKPKTVRVEVAVEVLADLLGRRFRAEDGSIVSMDSVRLGWNPNWQGYEAEPSVVRQGRPLASWADEAKRLTAMRERMERG